MPPSDQLDRPLRSLRVSVTDRCNLRCQYCMPAVDYTWLPKRDILSFEETARLVRVFTGLGVDRVRITGGEPLLRQDLPELVRLLRQDERIRDLALTTNGLLLEALASELKRAGLMRVTVSLDTLRPDRFEKLSRRKGLDHVLAGIHAVRRVGLAPLKIDTVAIRGVNDDELADLIEYGKSVSAEVRFIEYMDVGGATTWSEGQVVARDEILASLTDRFGGPVEPIDVASWAPAKRYRLPDGTTFGIVASTTAPFCRTCDRSRLTADGLWYLCLYATTGLDLRRELRSGKTDAELSERIASRWAARDDRGAERRFDLAQRGASVDAEGLRRDPHLEMHTKGG